MKKLSKPRRNDEANDYEIELFDEYEFPIFVEQVAEAAGTTPEETASKLHALCDGTDFKGWTPLEIAMALYEFLDSTNGAEKIARLLEKSR